jgi:hypothetical protein
MDCLLTNVRYRHVIAHEDFAFVIAIVFNEDPHSMPQFGELTILGFYYEWNFPYCYGYFLCHILRRARLCGPRNAQKWGFGAYFSLFQHISASKADFP